MSGSSEWGHFTFFCGQYGKRELSGDINMCVAIMKTCAKWCSNIVYGHYGIVVWSVAVIVFGDIRFCCMDW